MLYLAGKRFSRLTVVEFSHKTASRKYYWKCKCDCGKEILVRADSLCNGHTKSCGCLQKETISDIMTNNIQGRVFGRLTVIEKDYIDPKSECVFWRCICSCGNSTTVKSSHLLSGATKSCGCLQKEKVVDIGRSSVKDLCGDRFYKLLVIRRVPAITAHARWQCRCDCGNYIDVDSTSLISGNTKSCGCLNVSHRGSTDELEIKDYLQKLLPHTRIEKSKILDGKEIDIYIPALNLGIEYNGSAFHASIGAVFKNKPKTYHRDKFLLAKEKGIHLISIFDIDWWGNKNKIKQYLHDLVIPCRVLHYDNCNIDRLSSEEFREFESLYALHQTDIEYETINYGVYYDNELIAAISFSISKVVTDNKWAIMHSYSVKNGVTVNDGMSNLINIFETEFNPDYIVTVSNNDFEDFSKYTRIGFNVIDSECIDHYWLGKNSSNIDRNRYSFDGFKVYRSGTTKLIKCCHSSAGIGGAFGGGKEVKKLLTNMRK